MQHRTSRLRRLAGTAALATLALATIGTGVAGADPTGSSGTSGARGRAHLTAEQRQCLKDEGVKRPEGRPTKADAKALKDAAKACDIPLGRLMRHHIGHAMTDLTAEQRQCLADAGVTKPEGEPTQAERDAFKAAAESCGIDLPGRDGPGEGMGRGHRGPGLRLTAEQRQCLADAGVTRPEGRPTEDQRAAMRSAAESCGITLGRR
ncbi:MAG: hypothetical protein ACKO72_05000 [Actinomycetes bacterium]